MKKLTPRQIVVLKNLRDNGRHHQGGRGDHFRYRALLSKKLVSEEWSGYPISMVWYITPAGRKALKEAGE